MSTCYCPVSKNIFFFLALFSSIMLFLLYRPVVFLPEKLINNQCDSPIARHIASSAETIHGNVKCYHQSLFTFSESQHGRQP